VCEKTITELKLSDRVFVCVFCLRVGSIQGLQRFSKHLKIKTGAELTVATAERILKKYSEPFLTINKGSSLGESLLDEAGNSLPKQGVVH